MESKLRVRRLCESFNFDPNKVVKAMFAGAGVISVVHRGTGSEICMVKPKPSTKSPQRMDKIRDRLAEAAAMAVDWDQPPGSVRNRSDVVERVNSGQVPLAAYCRYLSNLDGSKMPVNISKFMKQSATSEGTSLRKRSYVEDAR